MVEKSRPLRPVRARCAIWRSGRHRRWDWRDDTRARGTCSTRPCTGLARHLAGDVPGGYRLTCLRRAVRAARMLPGAPPGG
ncbi:hypothetical protein RAA17_14375 [Komagataeibacter rhaeticus]|nr:hypothetical protein [Komagataeibacter rhaeticus]